MSDLLNKNWSTGTPITMAEILDAREHRAWIQQELLSGHTLEFPFQKKVIFQLMQC